MLHVCCIFVWMMIKMQWLPLILNGKSTEKFLVCLYKEIYFICITCLFDLGFVLKFQFSFVIFQFHKKTCCNSLIKGHLFIYWICLQSHFVKTNREKIKVLKSKSWIESWVEWIITSLTFIVWIKNPQYPLLCSTEETKSNRFGTTIG